MTADAVEGVWSRTRLRDWTWADLQGTDAPSVVVPELAEGVHREVRTVRSGETGVVDVPFRVELRPAELAGPRRRA